MNHSGRHQCSQHFQHLKYIRVLNRLQETVHIYMGRLVNKLGRFVCSHNGTARAIDIASDSSLGHPNIECCNLYSRICDLVPSRIWLQQMDPSELFFQQILEPLDNALKEGGVTTTIASIFGYTTAPVEYRGGNAVAASSSSSSTSTIQTVMSLSKGSGDVMDGINQAPTLKRMISPQGSGESDAVRNDWGMYSALDTQFFTIHSLICCYDVDHVRWYCFVIQCFTRS